jgi:hypothetical protein
MCTSDSFEQFANSNETARSLIDTITPSTDGSFRLTAPIVEELMAPVMEEMHRVEADRAMLSSMLPVIQGLIEHAETFSSKYINLSNSADDVYAESESEIDDSESDTTLVSVFRKRLIDFYMKDSMLAAYLLDPANFQTHNQGATFQLPWDAITDDEVSKLCDEVERLGGEVSLEQLQKVRSHGIRFKNKLDSMNAKRCVVASNAGAGEVARIAGIEDRQDLWASALKNEYPDLAVVAVKLLSMHVTSCASERNLSKFGRLYDKLRGHLSIERADKMVFVSQQRSPAVHECDDEEVLVAELEADVLDGATVSEGIVEIDS